MYTCSNDDQGRLYRNCTFYDPAAGVLVEGHIVDMLNIFFVKICVGLNDFILS